ncbi:hypothetical protein Syun_011490 [Stephania yunnanensis]|uniref:Uncharacterized protein n=1 Tax=Stephania yunnanensis TaxID=152371 RepID=A0AAP0PI67_9MAGN
MGLKSVVIAVEGNEESISAAQAVRPRPHMRCRDGDRRTRDGESGDKRARDGESGDWRARDGEMVAVTTSLATGWRRRQRRERQSRWFGERDRERDRERETSRMFFTKILPGPVLNGIERNGRNGNGHILPALGSFSIFASGVVDSISNREDVGVAKLVGQDLRAPNICGNIPPSDRSAPPRSMDPWAGGIGRSTFQLFSFLCSFLLCHHRT